MIENRSDSEVQVYLLHGRSRVSLGRVPALSSTRLTLPSHLIRAGEIRLLGEERPRIEGGVYRTDAFVLAPGQRVEWRLEKIVGRSWVSIRPGRGLLERRVGMP